MVRDISILAVLLIVCIPANQSHTSAQPPARSLKAEDASKKGLFDSLPYPPEVEVFLVSQNLVQPPDENGKRADDDKWLQRCGVWLSKSTPKDLCDISPIVIHFTYMGDFQQTSHSIECEPDSTEFSGTIYDRAMMILTFMPAKDKHLVIVSGTLLASSKSNHRLLSCRRVFEYQKQDNAWGELSFNCESVPAAAGRIPVDHSSK